MKSRSRPVAKKNVPTKDTARKTKKLGGTPVYEGWSILLKFGQREHLQAFRETGLLYMNSQRYFAERGLASDAVRADRFEGSDRIIQPWDIKRMTFSQKDGPPLEILPPQFVGPVLISFGGDHAWNIFCMFALTYPFPSTLIDERNFAFGDSFIMVLNTQAFIDRTRKAAVAAGFGWKCGPVEYLDYEKHSGETGPFRKPQEFAFQKEFRIAVRPGSRDPILLKVGDLTDITTPIFTLAKINTLIEIRNRPKSVIGRKFAVPMREFEGHKP